MNCCSLFVRLFGADVGGGGVLPLMAYTGRLPKNFLRLQVYKG